MSEGMEEKHNPNHLYETEESEESLEEKEMAVQTEKRGANLMCEGVRSARKESVFPPGRQERDNRFQRKSGKNGIVQ